MAAELQRDEKENAADNNYVWKPNVFDFSKLHIQRSTCY